MKILTVPDLHGKRAWEKIDVNKYDKIIFIGDYMDAFKWQFSGVDVRKNFKDMLYWAKQIEEGKLLFLLGNHEIHYLLYGTRYFESMRGSGFDYDSLFVTNALVEDNKELFAVAYQYDNYLWTHGGVTNTHWEEDLLRDFISFNSLADYLNLLWDTKDSRLMRIGKDRNGYDKQGSIFWCGKEELENDMLFGYHQIVGHTPVKDIEYCGGEMRDTSVTFIDCLDKVDKFYELEL
jgi:hypothetical protein